MAVKDQVIGERFAVYNGDCIETMGTMPSQSVGLSVYSPPFCGLYQYSSDERDLSNCDGYDQFFDHYTFVVREIARLTKPGRMTAVHCMDIPTGNSGGDGLIDFPGDIIRLHEREGWRYNARYSVWKEPLAGLHGVHPHRGGPMTARCAPFTGDSRRITPRRRTCRACNADKTAASYADRTEPRCRKCVRDGNEIQAPVPKVRKRLCIACGVERGLACFERLGGVTAECCDLCTSNPEIRVTLRQLDAAAVVLRALRQIRAARADGVVGFPIWGASKLMEIAEEALDVIEKARANQ